jgi:hypothetical protein
MGLKWSHYAQFKYDLEQDTFWNLTLASNGKPNELSQIRLNFN